MLEEGGIAGLEAEGAKSPRVIVARMQSSATMYLTISPKYWGLSLLISLGLGAR